jgi:hypothetical protein
MVKAFGVYAWSTHRCAQNVANVQSGDADRVVLPTRGR